MRRLSFWLLSLLVITTAYAQHGKASKAPQNWHNLDPRIDSVWGVGTERAYKELPIGKNSAKIIVAVIDAGTDIDHVDLKRNLWVNSNEVAGNGVDDDKNGYVDDIYGWNFIGGAQGNVNEDTYEYTRILASYLAKGLKEGEKPEFTSDAEKKQYQLAAELYEKNYKQISKQYQFYDDIEKGIRQMFEKTGKKNPTKEDIAALKVRGRKAKQYKKFSMYVAASGGLDKSPTMKSIADGKKQLNTMLNCNLNKSFNTRSLVGDHYDDVNEKFYGNNQVNAPNTEHGTHVAGIIAADRSNGEGVLGINDHVLIMTIRVVPNGDERDKDIANAIRYAVDNGAKIINMSFGKRISPNKKVIDDAVSYALQKDVLLVHAAGNDALNLTKTKFFPHAVNESTGVRAPNWIEVGASGWRANAGRVAGFSNYGKNEVDVFAPGVDVYSTIPDSKYEAFDGTSMASPVVAGVAALIRQNYPDLTAVQTRRIIMMSAIPCVEKVKRPGSNKSVLMSDLCVTGAIVNAYDALILAEKVSKGEVKITE